MEFTTRFLEVRRSILRSTDQPSALYNVWSHQNQLAYSIFRTFDFAKRSSTLNNTGVWEKRRYLLQALLKQLINLHKIQFYKTQFGIDITLQQRTLFDRCGLFLTGLSVFIILALAFAIVASLNSNIYIQGVPIGIANDIFSNITYDSGYTIKQESNKTHTNITGTYNNTNSSAFISSLSSILLIIVLCLIFCCIHLTFIVIRCNESCSFEEDCLKLDDQQMLTRYTTVLPPIVNMNEDIENGEHWGERFQHHQPQPQPQQVEVKPDQEQSEKQDEPPQQNQKHEPKNESYKEENKDSKKRPKNPTNQNKRKPKR